MDAKHIADLLIDIANANRRAELQHDKAIQTEAALWELAHRKGLREEVAEILEENS